MPVLRFLRGRLALWGGTAYGLGLLLLALVVGSWLLGRLTHGVVPLASGLVEPAFWLLGLGFLALVLDLFVLYNAMKPPRRLDWTPLSGARVVVGMTAYDDEASIG